VRLRGGRHICWQPLTGAGQRWWLMVTGGANQVVVERRPLVRGPSTVRDPMRGFGAVASSRRHLPSDRLDALCLRPLVSWCNVTSRAGPMVVAQRDQMLTEVNCGSTTLRDVMAETLLPAWGQAETRVPTWTVSTTSGRIRGHVRGLRHPHDTAISAAQRQGRIIGLVSGGCRRCRSMS
jgi:hypothetical protein